MDCVKIGNIISNIRKEKKLTQKQLAEQLGVQPKTVSKWECGLGCPDLTLWNSLSQILEVDMNQMMEGEIIANKPDVGKIDKISFYVCPNCGNILTSTTSASITCCGRVLEKLQPISNEDYNINVEKIDTDYYITFDHPMLKNHYISFVAYVKDDRLLLNRLYPEQSPEIRIPTSLCHNGKLYLYCINDGLSVYNI